MLIPGWPQIDAFPNELEAGERLVIEAYERLAESSEATNSDFNVYVQPYLDNYRPDLVVGIPGNGILIIEVKDWKTSSKTLSMKARAALRQVEFYRKQLLSLCAPDISSLLTAEELEDYETQSLQLLASSVTVAVAVPFLSRDEGQALFGIGSTPIIDSSKLGVLEQLVRPTPLSKTVLPPELRDRVIDALWTSIASWLMPPFHRAEQGNLSSSHLTKAQRPHAVSRGPGWYRLRGPAGSGKSLVLAHKAAVMAAEGKRVLLVCFNITLTHYLRDLVKRMRYDFAWDHIVIRHFHSLLKQIRLKFGVCFVQPGTWVTLLSGHMGNTFGHLSRP